MPESIETQWLVQALGEREMDLLRRGKVDAFKANHQ
jgi:hypothetical protein